MVTHLRSPPPPGGHQSHSDHKLIRQIDMSKRCRTTRLEGRTIDSAFREFRLDYEQTNDHAIGERVPSEAFAAGGHLWRIDCFPRGDDQSDEGEYLSIFVKLLGKARSVNAIFEAFLLDKHGEPCFKTAQRSKHLFDKNSIDWGWSQFISRDDLEEDYLAEGHITIICAIMVFNGSSTSVPPSDISEHFGMLLDSTVGTDVSFIIDSETFHAHRTVLAARSSVFKAELLGSMVEATMPSITLHDITPATFRVMLRFMYTDAFPGDSELGDSPFEMLQHLLAAADRYALERLKLMCARKLWDYVSVETVAATLACAEMYSCLELKNKCIDFFANEKNFRRAVLTEGFVQLVQQFPSIIAELRERPEI